MTDLVVALDVGGTGMKCALVRPDGYVAWVSDGSKPGLTDAMTTWFGPPAGGP